MKYCLGLLLSAFLVVTDQILKLLAEHFLKPMDTFPIIENVFHLTYLENRGASFGMMEGQKWLLVWGTALILLVLILAVMIGKIKSTFPMLMICCIIGGGVGNLIDRVYRGYVIDYIHVKIINFAIFNFADMCIVVGTALLIVYFLFSEIFRKKEEPAGDGSSAI